AGLPDCESVIVKEYLVYIGKQIKRMPDLSRHVVRGSSSPRVAVKGLRPQAKRAERRTTPSSVKRYVWMQEERHVVSRYVEVALVDWSHPWQLVKILDLWARGIMNYPAIVAIAYSPYVTERFAGGEFGYSVVEFLVSHEIDGFAGIQALLRQRSNVGSHECNLERGFGLFHQLSESYITVKPRSAGEQHDEIVVGGDLNGLFGTNAMRWSIKQAGLRYHCRRVGKPDRIPIGLNFTCCWPSGTSTSIKSLEGWGIQQ